MISSFSLINPIKEILVVRHSVLNGNSYDVEQLVDDACSLKKFTGGRNVVPCFEGDVVQIQETGEVVLTHQNFLPLPKKRYDQLREQKIAVSLEGALEKIVAYRSKHGTMLPILCLELKPITTKKTIDQMLVLLKSYRLEESVFIDSFYGGKLDEAKSKSPNLTTSLHAVCNVGRIPIVMSNPRVEPSIVTVPYRASFGSLNKPVIYGAVESNDVLKRVAEDPLVYGVYFRSHENKGLRGIATMLWNSVTNTNRLRKTQLSLYFSV